MEQKGSSADDAFQMLVEASKRTNTKESPSSGADDAVRHVAEVRADVATFSRQTLAIGEGNRDLLRQEP